MAPALAAQRATAVLRHVALHHNEGLTLSKLAERLDISPAAMHAVLTALLDSGLLERNESDKSFRLGPESVILGSAARSQHDDVAAATLTARRVAEAHGLPTTVLALRGEEILVLDGDGGHQAPINLGVPGHRVPFAPPFGTVFLVGAPPQQIIAWFERAGIDPASDLAERYRRELDTIAHRGWSVGTLGDDRRPSEAWDQLVSDVTALACSSEWRYVMDDLDEHRELFPAVFTVALPRGVLGSLPLALAVTGFTTPMTGVDCARLGNTIMATAVGVAAR